MTNLEESSQQLLQNLKETFSSVNMQTYLLIAFIIIMVMLWSVNYTQIYSHEVKINQAYAILTNLSDNVKNLSCVNEVEVNNSTTQANEGFTNKQKPKVQKKTIEPYDNENVEESYVQFNSSN